MGRISTTLAATALIVALLGITPLGHAAANAVRVALFAQNAGKVGNIRASRTPAPGKLLALDAEGKFPSSVLPQRATGAQYVSTIVVSPDRLSDIDSGKHLRRAVEDITDNGPGRPYLVKIEPGTYDLGSDSLALKPYVDVEGSGELTTIISSTARPGVMVAASNSELRFVSIRATNTVALVSENVSPRYTHVTATSSGGAFNYSIEITGGAPLLTHVTSSGTGGAQAAGLVNFGSGSNVTVAESSISGSGATSVNIGLLTYGGAEAISNSALSAHGGAIAVGLRVYNGTHSLANVTASGSAAPETYGLYSGYKGNAPTVTINQSRISGGTDSIFVFGGVARVGASQLSGQAATLGPAVVTCAASYDASFTPLSPSCG